MDTSDVYASDEVAGVIRLHQDLFTNEFRRLSIVEQLDAQAHRMLEAQRTGDAAATTHITCWHPELVGHPAADILARELTLDDTRETIAREYGFEDWSDAETRGTTPPDADFEAAVDAVLAGDVTTLRACLARTPTLVHRRSRYGHDATLLHYVGCNGVETHRQVVPRNLAEIAGVLLEAGADVDATAAMYGGDCTTLGLLVTSAFPAEAGVTDEVVRVLVEAGAETDDG